MHTLDDIQKHFTVSRKTALSWITSGELLAFNVGPAKSKRKLWRVSPAALAEFERKRSNQVAVRPTVVKVPTKQYI